MRVWEIHDGSYAPRLGSRQGAAVLLGAYFTVLFLLSFLNLFMVQGTTEFRHAQLSANQSRAFFNAEGGLDAAIAQLRNTSIPYLEPQECTAVGQATLCLVQDNRYWLSVTGSGPNGVTQPVSTILTITPNTLQFRHLAYAKNWLQAKGDLKGDLATETVSASGGPAITVTSFSSVKGDIFVGPDGDPAELVYVDSTSHINGTLGNLTALSTWPSADVPPEAVVLQDGTLGSSQQPFTGKSVCLPGGVYSIASVVQTGGAITNCDGESVTLYVSEFFGVSGGEFGGETANGQLDAATFLIVYTSTSVGGHGFMVSDTSRSTPRGQAIIDNSTTFSALVYAPNAKPYIWGSVEGEFAAIANAAQIGDMIRYPPGVRPPPQPSLVYPKNLDNRQYQVGLNAIYLEAWSAKPLPFGYTPPDQSL